MCACHDAGLKVGEDAGARVVTTAAHATNEHSLENSWNFRAKLNMIEVDRVELRPSAACWLCT